MHADGVLVVNQCDTALLLHMLIKYVTISEGPTHGQINQLKNVLLYPSTDHFIGLFMSRRRSGAVDPGYRQY